jgi:hypothetical protein
MDAGYALDAVASGTPGSGSLPGVSVARHRIQVRDAGGVRTVSCLRQCAAYTLNGMRMPVLGIFGRSRLFATVDRLLVSGGPVAAPRRLVRGRRGRHA